MVCRKVLWAQCGRSGQVTSLHLCDPVGEHETLPPPSPVSTRQSTVKTKGQQLSAGGMWSHLYVRIQGFFAGWKGLQTLSKPDMQISTGLEAQSLRESICGHIRILTEIESMTHSRKAAFHSPRVLGRTDKCFTGSPKTLEAQRTFRIILRTISTSLEEGYLHLTTCKAICGVTKGA